MCTKSVCGQVITLPYQWRSRFIRQHTPNLACTFYKTNILFSMCLVRGRCPLLYTSGSTAQRERPQQHIETGQSKSVLTTLDNSFIPKGLTQHFSTNRVKQNEYSKQ